MPMKKIVLAIVVGYLFMFIAGYLVHEVWLNADYMTLQEKEDSFRDVALMARKMPIMFITNFFFIAAFVWIYSRGVENKPWLGQGLRFSLCVLFLTVIPSSLGNYVVYRIPYMLAIKWIIAGSIVMVILGLIVAAICRKEAATA